MMIILLWYLLGFAIGSISLSSGLLPVHYVQCFENSSAISECNIDLQSSCYEGTTLKCLGN